MRPRLTDDQAAQVVFLAAGLLALLVIRWMGW